MQTESAQLTMKRHRLCQDLIAKGVLHLRRQQSRPAGNEDTGSDLAQSG